MSRSTASLPRWAAPVLGAVFVALAALMGGGLLQKADNASAANCGVRCYVNAVTGNDITGDGTLRKPFASIQMGVNTVIAGGQVFVAPGFYQEEVTVDKPVWIKGANAGRPRASTFDPAVASVVQEDVPFTVNVTQASVEGFAIDAFVTGVEINGPVGNVRVFNNLINSGGAGVVAGGCGGCRIENNTIGSFTTGVVLTGGGNNIVDRNNIGGAVFTVDAFGETNLTITETTVFNFAFAVNLFGVNGANIARNSLAGLFAFSVLAVDSNFRLANNWLVGIIVNVGVGGNSDAVMVENNFAGTFFVALGTGPAWNGTIDARRNWWGDASGPSGDFPGAGAAVVNLGAGTIIVDPVLCDGASRSAFGSSTGFQPTAGNCYI